MTDQNVRHWLGQYRTALEAQIALLHQLEAAASRQHETTEARNFEQLAEESDRRDRLTRSLLAIEEGLSVVRRALAASRAEVESLDEFHAVVALRRTASDLVARILATDRESMKVLADAELAAGVEARITERREARARRDFAAADRIRVELSDRGIAVEDTAGGTKWKRVR